MKNVSLWAMLLCFLLLPATVLAEEDRADVNITLAGDAVTINGMTGLSASSRVTAKVINPNGGLDFLGQTLSSSDGSFSFTYRISSGRAGEYTVYIGGNGLRKAGPLYFQYEPDTAPPTVSLLLNGEVVTGAVTIEDSTLASFEVNATDALSEVVLVGIRLDDDAYIEGSPMDWAGKLGPHVVHVFAEDAAGNRYEADYEIVVTTSIDSVKALLERYRSDGSLEQPLFNQLEQKLNSAEHHHAQGKLEQAAKFMVDFKRHLENQALEHAVAEPAKTALQNDAEFLIAEWIPIAQ